MRQTLLDFLGESVTQVCLVAENYERSSEELLVTRGFLYDVFPCAILSDDKGFLGVYSTNVLKDFDYGKKREEPPYDGGFA